jgi:PST family polysaccharide transporter
VPVNEVSRQSLTARYLTLSSGEIISKICVLLAFAYLARILGPREFGLIELSLSITLFFTLGIEAGLGSYGARLIAADPSCGPRLLGQIVVVRSLPAVVSFLIILELSARYGMPGLGILAIYGVSVLFVPLFTHWVFQGLGRMRWVAAGTALRNFIFSFLVFSLVREGGDGRLVAVSEVCGVAALVIFHVIGLRWRLKMRIDWHGAIGGARRVIAEAWSLGASEVTWAGLWYAPSIVVGLLARPVDVAWLAAALRVVLALHTFVWLYFFNLLPGMSRSYVQDREAWRQLTNRSLGTSMWLACLVAGTFTLAAPAVIRILYGDMYANATLPLQILIWMVPICWLSGHFRYSLIATGHQRLEFFGAATASVTTLVLAGLLVPKWLSVGAAVALVSGGIANAVATGYAVRKHVGTLRVVPAIAAPIAGCAVCLAAGGALGDTTGEIPASMLVFGPYLAAALITDTELVRLRQVWLGR